MKKNTISFYPVAEPDIGELEAKYVSDAVRSGWVSSLGRYIGEFEQQFAHYCGCRYGITTSNGTTALHLSLVSSGVHPGDEVIVPTLTFVATANAVAYTGAKPVFVDADSETWCLDPVAVERAISSRTRAIIVVHLYGHPADMDSILSIASKRGIPVIEDAAEAHGASYKSRRVGSLGKIGVFSFYGNKLITAGEGGMLVTDDEKVAERARFLRDHAMSQDRRYWHPEIGFNYRITNLQAALGLAQLSRIDEFLDRKREIMSWYRMFLGDLQLNPEAPWANSSYWMICTLLPVGISQEDFMTKLRSKGVDTRPFFHPIHTLPPYKGLHRELSSNSEGCPKAEDLAKRGINLPSCTKLNQADVRQITDIIKDTLNS